MSKVNGRNVRVKLMPLTYIPDNFSLNKQVILEIVLIFPNVWYT